MRIPIYVQLASLLLISSLLGLAVISIAVWVTTHSFVLDVRASRLSLTAVLKAAELASNLDVMHTSAGFITTRVMIQEALQRYNDDGNNTAQNWDAPIKDMQAAISGQASPGQMILLQARVYPRDAQGVNGPYALLNVTSQLPQDRVELPFTYADGSPVYLGDADPGPINQGYPDVLYPALEYAVSDSGVAIAETDGQIINQTSTLFLGPWPVNDTRSLMSLTMPIANNSNPSDVLAFLTVVMDARMISDTVKSREGLMKTGETLLVAPPNRTNRYIDPGVNNAADDSGREVRYVFALDNSSRSRHPNMTTNRRPTFNSSSFPAVNHALNAARDNRSNQSGSQLRARNENKKSVSVGYAFLATTQVNWLVIVEQTRDEVWQPINKLRQVIFACLSGTLGLMIIVSFPLARFATTPILRLREATRRSMQSASSNSRSSLDTLGYLRDGPADEVERPHEPLARKEGFVNPVSKWKRRRQANTRAENEERRKRVFKIPGKVKERKCFIRDELTDLTSTFNEMSDELMMQYSKLEERVQQRTAELEISKKAAEAANESKTLFIANVSHELKTPLNGILGMCAVCMQEEDPFRLKRSLGIIYKSGDLLLNLLTDLLTFSKNQVGQQLSLDEKEFRLRDISSQVLAIFDKQAKDGQIDLRVDFDGVPDLGNDNVSPERQCATGLAGTGRVRDMVLWGDVHRILQVVINLISNALKFTPAGGNVIFTIRALAESVDTNDRSISASRQSRLSSSGRRTSDTHTVHSLRRPSTAHAINPRSKPSSLSMVTERNVSPSPGRHLYFEFEVADTGPGIPEELQQKIFEPFVQGDLGLSRKFGGTGLGLSICSQLAGLMKGCIRLTSTVGIGSTFTLKIPLGHMQTRADSSASSALGRPETDSRRNSLEEGRASPRASVHGPVEPDAAVALSGAAPEEPKPVASEVNASPNPRLLGLSQPFFASHQPLESPGSQPAAMKEITAAATRGGKVRVLVAEDNKVNQEVVLRMLKLEDIYNVTVAKDGQEALDIVRETMAGNGQPFNLIFMDVQMPNVDGLESTRMIREMGYNAPIVALTAFSEDSNVKDCYASGMNYFLSKPIRRPQLKKVLREYCAPIPEEPEGLAPSPRPTPPADRRRSSGHSTTIVLLNGQADSSGIAAFASRRPNPGGHWEHSTDVFSVTNPPSTTTPTDNIVRSVSPRHMA